MKARLGRWEREAGRESDGAPCCEGAGDPEGEAGTAVCAHLLLPRGDLGGRQLRGGRGRGGEAAPETGGGGVQGKRGDD